MTTPHEGVIHRRFPAFGYASFRTYWLGGFVSDVGNWAQNTTVPYLTLQLTGEPLWVGIAGSAQLAAQVLAMVVGGGIADRYNRKTVILQANTLMLFASMALAALVWIDVRSPVAVIAMSALVAWLYGLQHPSWQSMPTDLVPERVKQSASHLTITKFQAARAIGPLVGGALLAGPGAPWALAFNGVTFFIAILAVVRIGRLAPGAFVSVDATDRAYDGLLAVFKTRTLAIAIGLVAIISLIGMPIVQLTPVLADDVYHVGPGAYGVLLSAFGIGSLVGATALAAVGHNSRRSRIVPISFTAFGSALVIAGVVDDYWVGIVAIAVTGMSFAVATSNLHAAIQLLAPSGQRGRAIALYLIALRGGSALGVLVLAWLSGLASAPLALACAGIALLMTAGWTALAHNQLRVLD